MDQISPGLNESATGDQSGRETPTAAEREAARQQPNGYIYRIDAGYDPAGRVPPEAIQGAWTVDAHGEIQGKFERNPNWKGSFPGSK